MSAVVVDASVAAKWVVEEEFSAQAASLLTGDTLHAPAHWLAEAVNVLWAKVARGQLAREEASIRAVALRQAPVRPAPLADFVEPALRLSLLLGVTVYNSLYIVLAQSLGASFVTADQRLIRKLAEASPPSDIMLPEGMIRWVGDI